MQDLNNDNDNIFFHRTVSKSEIDFIVNSDMRIIPIEVKFTNKQPSLPLAMKNFSQNYENIYANILITKNQVMKENEFYGIPAYLLPFIEL